MANKRPIVLTAGQQVELPSADALLLGNLTASRALVSGASSEVTSSTVTSTELGYVGGVTSGIQGQINGKQPLDATLTALAALNTTAGVVVQTGTDAFTKRTLTETANQVLITNPDGISGNPTFSLPQDIATGSSPSFSSINLSGFPLIQSSSEYYSTDIEVLNFGTDSFNASFDGTPLCFYWSNFNSGNGRLEFRSEGGNFYPIAAGAITGSSFSGDGSGLSNVTASAISFTVGATQGGTGLTSYAQGDILYASAINTLAKLAKSTTATRYLANTGSSNNPQWDQINLANGVTGDLPFANLTQGSALSVLGVTGNSTADVASIAAGSDHQVLRRSGTALAFGAVNLAQSAAVTGILPLANGGTGANLTDPNADRILFWDDSAGAMTWLATGNSLAITTTTLDTIQDIRTTASPTFSAVTLNGTIPLVIDPATEWYFNDQTIFEYGNDSSVIIDGTPIGLYWSNGDVGNNRFELRTRNGTYQSLAVGYVDSASGFYTTSGVTAGSATLTSQLSLGSGATQGVIDFNSSTANRIQFGTSGVAAPGASSAGMKIKLYGSDGVMAASDYAIGIESSTIWFNSDAAYSWYRDSSTRVMHIDGSGNLGIGSSLSPSALLDVQGTSIFRDDVTFSLQASGEQFSLDYDQSTTTSDTPVLWDLNATSASFGFTFTGMDYNIAHAGNAGTVYGMDLDISSSASSAPPQLLGIAVDFTQTGTTNATSNKGLAASISNANITNGAAIYGSSDSASTASITTGKYAGYFDGILYNSRSFSTANTSANLMTQLYTVTANDTSGSPNRYGRQLTFNDTGTYNPASSGQTKSVFGDYITLTANGATGTGSPHTRNVASYVGVTTNTGAVSSGSGIRNTWGGYFQGVGDTNGTSVAYGIQCLASGADSNYSIYASAGDAWIADRLGVGTAPTATNPAKVQIVSGTDFDLRLSNVETNTTTKTSEIVATHYTTAEEPVGIYTGDMSSGTNLARWGGGVSSVNAINRHEWYWAANNTTTTGTLKMCLGGTSGWLVVNSATATTTNPATPITAEAASAGYTYDNAGISCGTNVNNFGTAHIAFMGYHDVDKYGFIDAVETSSGYKNFCIVPNGGNFIVGLPTAITPVSAKLEVASSSATSFAALFVKSNSHNCFHVGGYMLTTTNNTHTTLAAIGTTTDTCQSILLVVTARRTGGVAGANGDAATYERTLNIRNIGGTVTVNGGAGSVDITAVYESQAGWAVDAIQSGTNCLIRVTGATNNNISWFADPIILGNYSS